MFVRSNNLIHTTVKTSRRMASSNTVRSTASSGVGGSAVYETERAVHEYLLFHFGSAKELMPYPFGPVEAANFSERVATIGHSYVQLNGGVNHRALDIGCAVGGLSFELSGKFNEVIGIDFSNHFIEAANKMKAEGRMEYRILDQGHRYFNAVAELPKSSKPNNTHFEQGDACNLNSSLGKFDLIVASNLLCRLPNPRKFLKEIPQFLSDKGILLLVSPYSWLEEYTTPDQWIGATDGEGNDSFTVLSKLLTTESNLRLYDRFDVPFIIREHARKFQYGVSDGTVWVKNT